MKAIITLTTFTFLLVNSFAQYKKASFFNKQGRTHEIGTNFSFIPNDGGAPVLSIVYTGSLETDKKVSLFSDLELMMKGKFAYNAEYYDNSNTVTGKLTGETPMYLMIKYGAQYRFINTEKDEETKLVPYARLGLLYGIALGADYKLKDKNGTEIDGGNATPNTPAFEVPFGFEAGAGVTYYFNKNLGLKLGANYRQFFQIEGITGSQNSDNTFYPLKSHPGVSISLKYRIFKEE